MHEPNARTIDTPNRRHLMLCSGRGHPGLADEVAAHLGITCAVKELRTFANGELYVRFGQSVRGMDAFVLQSHVAPINERIMEQLVMIDALKRASARRVSAVIPYYGYSRQDKKGRSREPISARLLADLLAAAGADRIISIDLHCGQIQGFFDGPVDHLTALPLLASYVKGRYGGGLTVVAPDAGRVRTAEKLANRLGCPMAFLHKVRSRRTANKVEVRSVVGEVRGRHCVLIDDMIDTAGTLTLGAEVLVDNGAEQVSAAATHAILSEPAIDRLKNAPLAEVVVTDTLPIASDRRLDNMVVLPIGGILAAAIRAVFEEASVSDIFGEDNHS